MNKLLDIEKKFQNYLLHSSTDIFNQVISTDKVSAETRLEIYGCAYRSRLHEALSTSYSVLEQYLGSEPFEELCYEYIASHPSQFRSIRWFGHQFAVFLKNHPHYKNFPYLSELAELEWTMALVFDAADSDVLQLEDMQNIPPEAWINMRLHVHPSVHSMSLAWNVVQIWQTITDEQTPAEPHMSTSKIGWILWRKKFMSQFSSLSEDEEWAIGAMINGLTFGEICEGHCQWIAEDNAGVHAASLLKGWITTGLISNVII